VVGDSFAFGWGVDENQRFSNLLAERLRTRVFNVAIGGVHIRLYGELLQYAESLGGRIDTVVIAVCMENDLLLYGARSDKDLKSGVRKNPDLALRNVKIWLTRHSALYRMFTTAVHQHPILRELAVSVDLLIPNLMGIKKNTPYMPIIESSAERLAEISRRYKRSMILIIPSAMGGQQSVG
jgi:hypothetical protein